MGEGISENYKVYKHTLPMDVSGKQNDMVYIGITRKKNVKQRLLSGRGYDYNLHFSRAIQKYGWNNFRHEVLFDGLSKEEAEQKEIYLIAYYSSTNPNKGYNVDSGGNSTGKHSEKTKQLISQKNKGRIHTEETRKKMSMSHIGVKKSEETRKKFSDAKSIPVICVETGVVYKSAYEARDALGIDNSTISKCCRGVNKTAGKLSDGTKLHWEYYKEVV